MSFFNDYQTIIKLLSIGVLFKFLLPRFSIQIKIAILYVYLFLLSAVSIPFIIFRPKDYRNLFIPFWTFRVFGKFLGFQIQVRGEEHIRREHGAVVIMNHQSFLDIFILAFIWPLIGRATIIVKKELFFFPCLGPLIWLSGCLFIDRKNKTNAIQTLNKESEAIKKRNCKILVFPEGTRNLKDKFLPFKKGCFHLATQNQCPIQPVVISQYQFLKNHTFFDIFKLKCEEYHIIINIMKEIPTTGVHHDNFTNFVESCQDLMQSECKLLNQELIESRKTN